MPDRPNILVICTDQHFAGAMSCAGNNDIDTPAIDRLAADGVQFPEAYCTSPLCTPSRASMLTGLMPHTTGVLDNGDELPEKYHDRTLGAVFEGAGYECAYGGKWHVPGVDPTDVGFERICDHNDLELANACIDFLERDHEAPFFLVASYDDPHNICEWARDQNLPWGNIDRVSTEACPSLPPNFHPPPFEPSVIRKEMKRHPKTMGAMVDASLAEWRQYRHAYYRLIERVDTEIGHILNVLEATDLREDTLVVFLSDHGDGNASHRINQKWWLYEEETRVPFVVAPPESEGKSFDSTGKMGLTADHLISTGLDLLPTLCDYADINVEADCPGRSVRPLIEDRNTEANGTDDSWRDALVVQTHAPVEGRIVRTERYKYIVYERGRQREQLFDLQNDREEMVDLSVNTDYEQVLDAHRERLLQWVAETDDVFGERYPAGAPLIPGGDPQDLIDRIDEYRGASGTGPCEF
jgi:arylsulfatase A-like enzyme